ncbi:hypothetical protein ENUP19_0099G0030 [Entamoeba nuttalli]|uniref:Uncharacterized protein n=2 Tax=Entamoeba nuttalli TaxID=412467 RepID=K2GX85_ENTNP|nr:hypothetical protein ENU1_113170 [Entamoeba nuttalli P19]EKE39838.1 hypothetical protein ENU1_113170 [Entamoeba nuttalli P19]|eukprot:XP_008857839.1 hypothetical protein ENU1_113170 [Entamoeba nuttalli P19]
MGLYTKYEVCIRRIHFKTLCKNECCVKWRKGICPWNKGKQTIKGFCFGSSFETSALLIQIISRGHMKIIIRIINESYKGKIIITNKNGNWVWTVSGDIVNVEGNVTKTYWNQLKGIKSEQITKESKEDLPLKTKKIDPDQLLLKEMLVRDTYQIRNEDITPKTKEMFISQKYRLETAVKEKRFDEVIKILKEDCVYKMNLELCRQLIKKVNCQGNEVFWLGCLIQFRKELVRNDTLNLKEVIVIGKIVGEIEGVLSMIENSIANCCKITANVLADRLVTCIVEETKYFKINGIIQEKIVGEIKNLLLQVKQEMSMTKNENDYPFVMQMFNNKVTKRIVMFDSWEILVLKYSLDEISQWCSSNNIEFTIYQEALHSKLTQS